MPQFNAPATYEAEVPIHQLEGMSLCSAAAEKAARMALVSGVFREGLTPKFTGDHAKHGRVLARL